MGPSMGRSEIDGKSLRKLFNITMTLKRCSGNFPESKPERTSFAGPSLYLHKRTSNLSIRRPLVSHKQASLSSCIHTLSKV